MKIVLPALAALLASSCAPADDAPPLAVQRDSDAGRGDRHKRRHPSRSPNPRLPAGAQNTLKSEYGIMTFHIDAGDVLVFVASLALVVGGAWLSIRFVSRSISRGSLQELEAANRALEFEIARMKQREELPGG